MKANTNYTIVQIYFAAKSAIAMGASNVNPVILLPPTKKAASNSNPPPNAFRTFAMIAAPSNYSTIRRCAIPHVHKILES